MKYIVAIVGIALATIGHTIEFDWFDLCVIIAFNAGWLFGKLHHEKRPTS